MAFNFPPISWSPDKLATFYCHVTHEVIRAAFPDLVTYLADEYAKDKHQAAFCSPIAFHFGNAPIAQLSWLSGLASVKKRTISQEMTLSRKNADKV